MVDEFTLVVPGYLQVAKLVYAYLSVAQFISS